MIQSPKSAARITEQTRSLLTQYYQIGNARQHTPNINASPRHGSRPRRANSPPSPTSTRPDTLLSDSVAGSNPTESEDGISFDMLQKLLMDPSLPRAEKESISRAILEGDIGYYQEYLQNREASRQEKKRRKELQNANNGYSSALASGTLRKEMKRDENRLYLHRHQLPKPHFLELTPLAMTIPSRSGRDIRDEKVALLRRGLTTSHHPRDRAQDRRSSQPPPHSVLEHQPSVILDTTAQAQQQLYQIYHPHSQQAGGGLGMGGALAPLSFDPSYGVNGTDTANSSYVNVESVHLVQSEQVRQPYPNSANRPKSAQPSSQSKATKASEPAMTSINNGTIELGLLSPTIPVTTADQQLPANGDLNENSSIELGDSTRGYHHVARDDGLDVDLGSAISDSDHLMDLHQGSLNEGSDVLITQVPQQKPSQEEVGESAFEDDQLHAATIANLNIHNNNNGDYTYEKRQMMGDGADFSLEAVQHSATSSLFLDPTALPPNYLQENNNINSYQHPQSLSHHPEQYGYGSMGGGHHSRKQQHTLTPKQLHCQLAREDKRRRIEQHRTELYLQAQYRAQQKQQQQTALLQKVALRKTLDGIRDALKTYLQAQRHPLQGAILRCVDDSLLFHLLEKYDGFQLSPEAILLLLGNALGTSILLDPTVNPSQQEYGTMPPAVDNHITDLVTSPAIAWQSTLAHAQHQHESLQHGTTLQNRLAPLKEAIQREGFALLPNQQGNFHATMAVNNYTAFGSRHPHRLPALRAVQQQEARQVMPRAEEEMRGLKYLMPSRSSHSLHGADSSPGKVAPHSRPLSPSAKLLLSAARPSSTGRASSPPTIGAGFRLLSAPAYQPTTSPTTYPHHQYATRTISPTAFTATDESPLPATSLQASGSQMLPTTSSAATGQQHGPHSVTARVLEAVTVHHFPEYTSSALHNHKYHADHRVLTSQQQQEEQARLTLEEHLHMKTHASSAAGSMTSSSSTTHQHKFLSTGALLSPNRALSSQQHHAHHLNEAEAAAEVEAAEDAEKTEVAIAVVYEGLLNNGALERDPPAILSEKDIVQLATRKTNPDAVLRQLVFQQQQQQQQQLQEQAHELDHVLEEALSVHHEDDRSFATDTGVQETASVHLHLPQQIPLDDATHHAGHDMSTVTSEQQASPHHPHHHLHRQRTHPHLDGQPSTMSHASSQLHLLSAPNSNMDDHMASHPHHQHPHAPIDGEQASLTVAHNNNNNSISSSSDNSHKPQRTASFLHSTESQTHHLQEYDAYADYAHQLSQQQQQQQQQHPSGNENADLDFLSDPEAAAAVSNDGLPPPALLLHGAATSFVHQYGQPSATDHPHARHSHQKTFTKTGKNAKHLVIDPTASASAAKGGDGVDVVTAMVTQAQTRLTLPRVTTPSARTLDPQERIESLVRKMQRHVDQNEAAVGTLGGGMGSVDQETNVQGSSSLLSSGRMRTAPRALKTRGLMAGMTSQQHQHHQQLYQEHHPHDGHSRSKSSGAHTKANESNDEAPDYLATSLPMPSEKYENQGEDDEFFGQDPQRQPAVRPYASYSASMQVLNSGVAAGAGLMLWRPRSVLKTSNRQSSIAGEQYRIVRYNTETTNAFNKQHSGTSTSTAGHGRKSLQVPKQSKPYVSAT